MATPAAIKARMTPARSIFLNELTLILITIQVAPSLHHSFQRVSQGPGKGPLASNSGLPDLKSKPSALLNQSPKTLAPSLPVFYPRHYDPQITRIHADETTAGASARIGEICG